ncbi:TPA: hypothetical protein ACH3X1_013965 [Trebouxia sp. C0004]
MQEVHVDGADSAGLALAIRLAENMSAGSQTKICVWDGRLRRLGLRGRRLGFIATAALATSSQIATLQNDIFSASLSPNAQAAVFAQSKERHWQHAANTSIAKVEQALLRYAQSPALSQHINFKLYDLAGDMLHTIASKPNVVIVGATGSRSAVRSLLVPAQEPQTQQDIAHGVEIGYKMTAELKLCLKDYAATSLVITVGQRVFLHNYDCQEGTGSISIRVTKGEFDALEHCDTASGSLSPNSTMIDGQDKQLPPMQSLAAKSLSHLIDSALHVYGVPPTSVRQTVGVSCSAWQAPVVAQELHMGTNDTAVILLIGDAAMQVEFWPGRGINTALASAHLAAVTLLASMTHDPAQPCFAPSPAHLAHFSRQMTDMADRLRAYPSMDVLAIPSPSPRWSEVAAKMPEEVVHQLMEQVCNRGATAVDHLWPILPSHALVEAKLRQMLPERIHVLRRMLRDGPWPGHGAKVMAALELPPLPTCHTHPSTVLSRQNHPAAVVPVQDGTVEHAPCPANSPAQQQMVSRKNPSSLQTASSRQNASATLALCLPQAESVIAAPSTDSATQASLDPSAPAAVRQIKITRKASSIWETDSNQSASSSVASSILHDSPALSDIDVKMAVLAKWGQPLPQLPAQAAGESSSRKAPGASRKVPLRPLLKKNKQQAGPQGTPQGLTGATTQFSSSAMSASPGKDLLAAAAPAAASTIQASDSMHSQAPLDKLSSTLVQASTAATAAVSASCAPAQSPAVPQLIPSLLLQPPPAPQPSLMPRQNHIPVTFEEPGPTEPSCQMQLPAQSPLQMWPHVRKFSVPEPLKATPLPTPKKPQDPGKAPGGQAKVAQAGAHSQSRAPSTDKSSAQSSVQRQPPAPAIPSGQSLSPDASPVLSSGQSQSLGVSQVTTLGQHQCQAEPPATASGRRWSSTALPAAVLGRNKSLAASPAPASGQQQAPASSLATPSGHSHLASSVMSPATLSGQQLVTAVSPAVPSRYTQSPLAFPPARKAMLLSPEQPTPPPRPEGGRSFLPQGHPPPSQTAACQFGQRRQAQQLQNREPSLITDPESANEALPGLTISAALSPIPILRSSPLLGQSSAPDSSLPQLASELPMSSQRQGESPGQPQTPLPACTLRHVRCQNASEMSLRLDTIRRLQSQRANRIMHACHALPDIRVRPEKSGQVQSPEWLLQADLQHDVWQTPQVASNWSAKGNPLFGWWELGSAVVGYVSDCPHAADFSPCTPHRSEATEMNPVMMNLRTEQ